MISAIQRCQQLQKVKKTETIYSCEPIALVTNLQKSSFSKVGLNRGKNTSDQLFLCVLSKKAKKSTFRY